jgi:uncharacterized membrane protein
MALHFERRETRTRPHTVEELTRRNVETVAAIDRAIEAERGRMDRMVDSVTAFSGSIPFVWVHIIWFGGWIAVNTLAPSALRFDPYPFQFLTLVVSLEAIFLATFILITQNRQARIDELRNHLDLQINLLSEQENTKMLESIQEVLGCGEHDPEVAALERATRPEKLVEQIERIIERRSGERVR